MLLSILQKRQADMIRFITPKILRLVRTPNYPLQDLPDDHRKEFPYHNQ